MAFTKEELTQLYIATFNRAPDEAGLNYWLNESGLESLEEVAESFFESEEAQSLYGNTNSVQEMVEAAYVNLFGREADSEGLEYWTQELESGEVSESHMIVAMMNGAQGSDAVVLDNKTAVGLAFAEAGLSDTETAYDVMEIVSDDENSVEEALSTIELLDDEESSEEESSEEESTEEESTEEESSEEESTEEESTEDTLATTSLSEEEVAGLLYMFEEEKLAMNIYDTAQESYDTNIFTNISDSEERHMDAVLTLLEANGIDVSALTSLPDGEFQNEELQSLYDTLIQQTLTSYEDALNVGIAIEETDMADLTTHLEETTDVEIVGVYTNLNDGSQNHLDAFTRVLEQTL